MKHLIIFLCLLFSITCITAQMLSNKTDKTTLGLWEELKIEEAPYEIELEIVATENGAYNLLIEMKLYDESHFVSPFSRNEFLGKFTLSIDSNKKLKMDKTFIETPRSVEELDNDPFVDGPINWVRVNTSYQYSLSVLEQEDFKATGSVQFVIEPRCTLEQIPFTIAYRNGKMTIEKGVKK